MTAASERLRGKRVLITGGAGGVGRAVARLMLEAHACVLIADREAAEPERLLSELLRAVPEGTCEAVAADLSSREGLARMYERVDGWLGGLDILVAAAGVGSGPLMEMPEEDWRNVIESNLVSYVASTQGAIERVRASGVQDGQVILIGSISVHIKAVGESVYNAAKGGVAAFAETLRKEMMPEHIRISLIEPGAIGSAMQPFTPEERARFVQESRMLAPEDVAEAIMFAATRRPGVDVVTLRIEPLVQKIS